jgi:hypothetical protein
MLLVLASRFDDLIARKPSGTPTDGVRVCTR